MNASPARTGLSELIHGFLPGAGMIFLLACLAGLMTGPAGAAASMAPAEQSATGVHGFVIRLASTSRSFTANDADDLDIPAAHRVYITTFRKDGEVWQQLRVGFFAGKAEALAILKRIEPRFPGAQVTAVTSVDRKSSTVNLLASRPAAGKMPAQAVTDAAIPRQYARRPRHCSARSSGFRRQAGFAASPDTGGRIPAAVLSLRERLLTRQGIRT